MTFSPLSMPPGCKTAAGVIHRWSRLPYGLTRIGASPPLPLPCCFLPQCISCCVFGRQPSNLKTRRSPQLPGNFPDWRPRCGSPSLLPAADWLAPEEWVNATPIRYVADAYLLLSGAIRFPPDMPICPGGGGSPACARDVDTIAWPVTLPPDGIGPPFRPPNGAQSSAGHCAVISFSFASALAAAMEPGDGGLGGHLYLTASIAWRAWPG